MFSKEEIKNDLEQISVWLKSPPEKIKVKFVKTSISLFSKQIDEMINTYKYFPKEKNRTKKIFNLINNGGKCLPVFVEEKDSSHFIMEGRHRIVAFQQLGIKEIYVAYCSV